MTKDCEVKSLRESIKFEFRDYVFHHSVLGSDMEANFSVLSCEGYVNEDEILVAIHYSFSIWFPESKRMFDKLNLLVPDDVRDEFLIQVIFFLIHEVLGLDCHGHKLPVFDLPVEFALDYLGRGRIYRREVTLLKSPITSEPLMLEKLSNLKPSYFLADLYVMSGFTIPVEFGFRIMQAIATALRKVLKEFSKKLFVDAYIIPKEY